MRKKKKKLGIFPGTITYKVISQPLKDRGDKRPGEQSSLRQRTVPEGAGALPSHNGHLWAHHASRPAQRCLWYQPAHRMRQSGEGNADKLRLVWAIRLRRFRTKLLFPASSREGITWWVLFFSNSLDCLRVMLLVTLAKTWICIWIE